MIQSNKDIYNLNMLKQTIHWLLKEGEKCLALLHSAEVLNDVKNINKYLKRLEELAARILVCDRELVRLQLIKA